MNKNRGKNMRNSDIHTHKARKVKIVNYNIQVKYQ